GTTPSATPPGPSASAAPSASTDWSSHPGRVNRPSECARADGCRRLHARAGIAGRRADTSARPTGARSPEHQARPLKCVVTSLLTWERGHYVLGERLSTALPQRRL